MQGPHSPSIPTGRTVVVTDPCAARVLLQPETLHYFAPFLGRELTVTKAAQLLGCNANSLLVRVRRMRACGLLDVVREEPRAGRAIKVYRSVADAFFVPLAGHHADNHALWVQARAQQLRAGLHFSRSHASSLKGHRIYRDAEGVVNHALAMDAETNYDALAPTSPADFMGSHDALYLDFADAKRLQTELHALFERYRALSGSQRYLLWLSFVPLPSSAAPTRD